MTQNPQQNKSAWVQLYEARRAAGPVEAKTPGRPPALVPRRKYGLTLSQGEFHELEAWQERMTHMLRRKLSMGETVGILTRVCTGRLDAIGSPENYTNLGELVEKMIGKE
jgi:hypothetical protein